MVNLKKSGRKKPARRMSNERMAHLMQMYDKVGQENLELVKQQNRDYLNQCNSNAAENTPSNSKRKPGDDVEISKIKQKRAKRIRKAELSEDPEIDSPSESDVQENYNKWKQEEYDTYNAVSRKVLVSRIEMLDKALQVKNKNRVNDCGNRSISDFKIKWSSPMYIIRHVRKCILSHRWAELSNLLPLLLNHHVKYESFLKEITFLTTLMTVNRSDANLLEDLELCFTKEKETSKSNEFDIWFVQQL